MITHNDPRIATLRALLDETEEMREVHFDGAGSERGFDAVQCSGCGEGYVIGDVLRPYKVDHAVDCPLNPARRVPVDAALLRELLAQLEK